MIFTKLYSIHYSNYFIKTHPIIRASIKTETNKHLHMTRFIGDWSEIKGLDLWLGLRDKIE